ncbi:MAG: SurA N-terminal domain-containing protein, partial [Thermodesulfobacteriota bacterium]
MEDHLKKIDKVTCPSCSNQNEEENRFCVHCGNPILKKGKTLAKRHRILFGLIGLILIGSITFFAIGALDPRLVGRVNGEGISRKEFSRRLERAKRFYELKYGKGLFEGEKGKENLNLLKSDILDEMVVEKILLQEA